MAERLLGSPAGRRSRSSPRSPAAARAPSSKELAAARRRRAPARPHRRQAPQPGRAARRSTPAATTGSTCWWTGSCCARTPRSACAPASRRPSTSPATSSSSPSRAAASGCSAGSSPASAATSRCPSSPRAPSRSTAPTAPAPPATAWACAGRWTPRGSSPTSRRALLDGAIQPWQRHGPRLLREALGGRGRAPRLLARGARSPTCRPKAREVLLHGDDNGFPGVVPYLRARVTSLLCGSTRSPADEAPQDGGRGLRGPAALPHGGGLPGVPRRAAAAREPGRARGRRTRWRTRTAAARARAARPRPALAFPERERPVASGSSRRSGPAASSSSRGRRLPDPRPAHDHALGRRGAPHPPRHPDRRAHAGHRSTSSTSRRSGLHQRDNAPPARDARRDPRPRATPWWSSSTTRRRSAPPTTWWTSARAPASTAGRLMYSGPARRRSTAASTGALPARRARRSPVPPARRPARGGSRILRRAREQPARHRRRHSRSACSPRSPASRGSGKSTLVDDILHRALAQRLYRAAAEPGAHRAHRGRRADRQGDRDRPEPDRPHAALEPGDLHRRLRLHPRAVRLVPEARARGYKPGRFSFNVKGGRCEACQGDGVRRDRDALPARRAT